MRMDAGRDYGKFWLRLARLPGLTLDRPKPNPLRVDVVAQPVGNYSYSKSLGRKKQLPSMLTMKEFLLDLLERRGAGGASGVCDRRGESLATYIQRKMKPVNNITWINTYITCPIPDDIQLQLNDLSFSQVSFSGIPCGNRTSPIPVLRIEKPKNFIAQVGKFSRYLRLFIHIMF